MGDSASVPATYWSAFERGAGEVLGRPLSGDERARFDRYLGLLVEWSRVHRLIGSSDPAWILERLFLDSLLFRRALPRDMSTLVDIGSGAGIPAIPIKIVNLPLKVMLIESRRRRVSFLKSAIRELGLSGVSVLEARSEDAPTHLLGTFDAATARCAGRPERVLGWALPLVRPGGVVVVSAGAGADRARRPPHGADLVRVQGYKQQLRSFWVQRRS